MSALNIQGDLFAGVVQSYLEAPDGQLSNNELYAALARTHGLDDASLAERTPIGKSGQKHNVLKRTIRWYQQTLRQMGVLQRSGKRGIWRLAEEPVKGLSAAKGNTRLVAFSTTLGVAIWGRCEGVFEGLDQNINLLICSPPYALQQPRAYGNERKEQDYIDFITRSLESVVEKLAPGGSVCVNVSNDIFLPGMPARSLYREKLVIGLSERLGLFKVDELIWRNPSRIPGPVAWASKKRFLLNSEWEPVYWFTNDPTKLQSDNRRVLEAHTRAHLDLMHGGGERRVATYGDGAYRIRHGSYSNVTPGKIPRNIITRGHSCADTRQYRRDAIELGLPVHGAMQPLSLPDFLIRFLTKEDDLVVDIFGGTVKTGMAAERNKRRWIVVEMMLQYLRGAAPRFSNMPGFSMPPEFAAIRG